MTQNHRSMAATDLVMVPQRHYAAAAGRQYARRLFLCAALVVLAGNAPLAAPATEPHINVTESGGVYRVDAAFTVPQSAAIAAAVLTDFERIPTFMPDMKTSTVLERSDAGTIVEQEAVARFMMFSKRVHLVLQVSEEGGTIRFRDRCGKSFERYEGSWTIAEKSGVTTIAYTLIAKPTFEVPAFVLKRLMKRDAAEMIGRLQSEIGARAPYVSH